MPKPMTDAMKQKWIDLSCLIQSSFISTCDKKMVITLQYPKKYEQPDDVNPSYNLRIALRSVGHKINRVKKIYGGDYLAFVYYSTSVSEEEHEKMRIYYNEWIDETHTYDYIDEDTDCESDSESESESEEENDPSV